jgi:hypothetical protein
MEFGGPGPGPLELPQLRLDGLQSLAEMVLRCLANDAVIGGRLDLVYGNAGSAQNLIFLIPLVCASLTALIRSIMRLKRSFVLLSKS